MQISNLVTSGTQLCLWAQTHLLMSSSQWEKSQLKKVKLAWNLIEAQRKIKKLWSYAKLLWSYKYETINEPDGSPLMFPVCTFTIYKSLSITQKPIKHPNKDLQLSFYCITHDWVNHRKNVYIQHRSVRLKQSLRLFQGTLVITDCNMSLSALRGETPASCRNPCLDVHQSHQKRT